MQWTLFCRVIDNLGDVGVCWRLARELAARGQQVRLVIDDAQALTWMAPGGAAGVQVLPWQSAPTAAGCGEVVVEAFGCDPPAAVVQAMAARARHAQPPVWINLEYLSAEPYVERCHGLASPQQNGLMKWFFYPGFTPRTGGLLREPDLMRRVAAADGSAFLASLGCTPLPGERVVSLFCYDNPALPALLHSLAAAPTLLLLTPGPAQQQVRSAPTGVRMVRLPWLTQADYDRLLWACDLNFVRGEDSLVRALWAGKPFVWQAYPQHDGAHLAKLQAFVDLWPMPPAVVALWRAWNGLGAACWPGLPASQPGLHSAWQQACYDWRHHLAVQASLADQLLAFVASKTSGELRAGC